MAEISVLIVDDSAAVRDGLQGILRGHSDITVIGMANDGLEALQLVDAFRPDIVLMDAQMPRLDGAGATRRIKAQWPRTRVIFLTVHAALMEDGLLAGADAALLKDVAREELLRVIRGRS